MAQETIITTVSNDNASPISGMPSRRTIMNMLVTSAVFASAKPAMSQDDPIFAAIDAHKQINARLQAAFDVKNALEDSLPANLRRSEYDHDGFQFFENDDPRWVEAVKLVDRLLNEETDFSIGLLHTQPTTWSGVKALLTHVSAYEAEGNEWPSDLIEEGSKKRWGKPWGYFFHANLADALQRIA